MRRTGRKSSRSRNRRSSQLRQAQCEGSFDAHIPRAEGPCPATGAIRRNNQPVLHTSRQAHRTSFADEVKVHLIPLAWQTPDIYYTETGQENRIPEPRRELFPEEEDDSAESPPFKVVAVPVEVDLNAARLLPPLGIVYEYDPSPSWITPQYPVPPPDDERTSRTRQYEPRPGLATAWERNEERARRRERRHRSPQRYSSVSPDEYVPPLENWFKTPGYMIADLLRQQRELDESRPINYYDDIPVSSPDENSTTNNDPSSNPDTCDCDEKSDEYDDEFEKENYQYNRQKFQDKIVENSESFKIFCDSPDKNDNRVNSNTFTVPPNAKGNRVNSDTFTVSPSKKRNHVNNNAEQEAETGLAANQGNGAGFAIYMDSPEQEAVPVGAVPQTVNTSRPLAERAVPEAAADLSMEERIDKIMKYLDFQDYIERKSIYRHMKKVQQVRRDRIFKTLMGIDIQQEKSPDQCADGEEQISIEESSHDDTDGSYYCPGYGTPQANEKIKKKL